MSRSSKNKKKRSAAQKGGGDQRVIDDDDGRTERSARASVQDVDRDNPAKDTRIGASGADNGEGSRRKNRTGSSPLPDLTPSSRSRRHEQGNTGGENEDSRGTSSRARDDGRGHVDEARHEHDHDRRSRRSAHSNKSSRHSGESHGYPWEDARDGRHNTRDGESSHRSQRRTVMGSDDNNRLRGPEEYVTAWDENANEIVQVNLPAPADRVLVWDNGRGRFTIRNLTASVSQMADRSRASERRTSHRGRSRSKDEGDRTPRSGEIKVESGSAASKALYSTPTSEPTQVHRDSRRRESHGFISRDRTVDLAHQQLLEPERAVGETRSDYARRLAAAQRVEAMSAGDMETGERSIHDRREWITAQSEELTRQEAELEQRLISLSEERRRMDARARTSHYMDWQDSARVLDRWRDEEITATGSSSIPPRDQRTYPGRAQTTEPRRTTTAESRRTPTADSRRTSSRDENPPTSSTSTRKEEPAKRSSKRSHHSNRSDSPTRSRGSATRQGRRTRHDPPPSSSPSPSSSGNDDSDDSDSDDDCRRGDNRQQRSRNHSREEHRDDHSEGRMRDTRTVSRAPNTIGFQREATVDPSILLMQHEDMVVDKYRQLVRERIGEELLEYREIKAVQVDPPKKYSGVDDIEVFEEWLNGQLRLFRFVQLCGPEKDQQRVDLCGHLLEGISKPSRST